MNKIQHIKKLTKDLFLYPTETHDAIIAYRQLRTALKNSGVPEGALNWYPKEEN